MIRQIWSDQRGEIYSFGLLFWTTIVVIGSVVGLATFREQLVQELGDVAIALENINQSYSTPSSSYTDVGPFPVDPVDDEPACLDVTVNPSGES